jgi:hypothetical protein
MHLLRESFSAQDLELGARLVQKHQRAGYRIRCLRSQTYAHLGDLLRGERLRQRGRDPLKAGYALPRLLSIVVEPGILHRQCGAPAQVLGKGEIGRVEVPAALRHTEGDRTQVSAVGDQGHDHGRNRRELPEHLQVHFISGVLLETLRRDLAEERRLPAPQHVTYRVAMGAPVMWIAHEHGTKQLFPARLRRNDLRPLQRSVLPQEVDDAPVRQPGHHQVRHVMEPLRLVHGSGEDLPRLSEQALPMLSPPAPGDVSDDDERSPWLALAE